MPQIISAIYDKVAKTYGRPIFQKNVESAIQGVKDALNTRNTQGDYIMPTQREHPENYALVLLGHFDEEREEIIFHEKEDGTVEVERKFKETPPILLEFRVLIEFKDIELKDESIKMTPEMLAKTIESLLSNYSENVNEAGIRLNQAIDKIEQKAKEQKHEQPEMGKTDMGSTGGDNRSRRNLLRFLK